MKPLHWIEPDEPPECFPDPVSALRDPDGLLAAGGDLSPARLLAAYRRGIFPWYNAGEPILWWCPDPRAVLYPAELHISRSLARTLRRSRFSFTLDRDFAGVIDGCAQTPRRGQPGTWINPAMHSAYRRLHALGHAHSLEVWQNGILVGGVYGVAVGRVFFGESMFSRARDASKAALVVLLCQLPRWGFPLLDCQVASPHLTSLGSRLIPRSDFLAVLDACCPQPGPTTWTLDSTSRTPEAAHGLSG